MGILIDSSVLIQLERENKDLAAITELDDELAISAITASELLFGLHRAQTPQQRAPRQAFVNRALEMLPIIPFDLEVAHVHARLWADLTLTGLRIGPHDLIIAATALTHGHAVLTHNLREFQRVPDLIVRQPGW